MVDLNPDHPHNKKGKTRQMDRLFKFYARDSSLFLRRGVSLDNVATSISLIKQAREVS